MNFYESCIEIDSMDQNANENERFEVTNIDNVSSMDLSEVS